MKELFIGKKKLSVPIIQGGMGIGISRCRLAGAVAREGGMGVISAAQAGYDHPEFKKSPMKTNLLVLPEQIRKAREIAGGNGLIGVNIMVATNYYEEHVKAACQAGADTIISGAGLPTMLPQYVEGTETKIAPIVSSEKSVRVILKYWDKKYNRTADFVVIEGPKAGGHLGFDKEELQNIDQLDFDLEIRNIIDRVHQYEEQFRRKIPVFVAGGIATRQDVLHALSLGADGVQVGSRFVATHECDASEAYKEAYVKAKPEDIVLIDSPVGLPGRAVRNEFVRDMEANSQKITFCYNCLKACNPKKAKYCISKALMDAAAGDVENGLIFCGARIGEIDRISGVKEVIDELMTDNR